MEIVQNERIGLLLISNLSRSWLIFVAQRAAASVKWIEQLNPLVHLTVDEQNIKEKDSSYFHSFNVVCATNCSLDTMVRCFVGEMNELIPLPDLAG